MISDLIFGGSSRLQRGPEDPWWYSIVRPPVASGVEVNDNTALTVSAVWAASRLLSSTIGWIPLNLRRRLPGGGSEVVREDRRQWIVHNAPNSDMTAISFRASMALQQVNAGNCYAEIQRLPNGEIASLWPIHHSRVELVRDDQDRILYKIKHDNGEPSYIPQRDMLHVPSSMSHNGIDGLGVLHHARETIGLGLAAEKHGASTFGNGAIPRAVLTGMPNSIITDDDKRKQFRREWSQMYSGPNAEKLAITGAGVDLKVLGFTSQEAQMLETRQFTVEEVARWYGVPPHKLKHLLRATFNNIEHLAIEFVQDDMMPWLVSWEQKLDATLLTEQERRTHFFKFNVNALLRGDSTARANFYQSMLTSAVMNRNEVRALEDLNPVEGGDTFLVQGAMVPVDQAGMFNGSTDQPNDDSPDEEDSSGNDVLMAEMSKQIEALRAELDSVRETNAERLQGIVDDIGGIAGAVRGLDRGDEVESLRSELQAMRDQVRSGALLGFSAALGSMVRKHAQAARRAVSSPSFVEWLDGYSDKYRGAYIDGLGQSVQILAAAGISVDAEAVVDRHLARAKEELLDASGAPREEFADAVGECVTRWENERAGELSAYALGDMS